MATTIEPPGYLSDRFVFALAHAIPEYSFERDESGSLIVAPNHTDGGAKSGEAYYQLRLWRERTKAGGRTFDATSGFNLPTSALRAPDASWISDERSRVLSAQQRTGFWNVCPDVVVEVASNSDSWKDLCEKIDGYLKAGARYAVAIDPKTRERYERGTAPPLLQFDFDAIIDA